MWGGSTSCRFSNTTSRPVYINVKPYKCSTHKPIRCIWSNRTVSLDAKLSICLFSTDLICSRFPAALSTSHKHYIQIVQPELSFHALMFKKVWWVNSCRRFPTVNNSIRVERKMLFFRCDVLSPLTFSDIHATLQDHPAQNIKGAYVHWHFIP